MTDKLRVAQVGCGGRAQHHIAAMLACGAVDLVALCDMEHAEGLTILDELSAGVGEACFLGVLQGDATVTVVESIPPAARLIGSWIGRGYPAFCSDAGQAVLWDASDDEIRGVFSRTEFRSAGPNAATSVDEFLSRLNDARERGYAVVAEEAEPGLYSVSVPVWDFRGEVIAGLQIVGERTRLEPRSEALGAACVDAARRLSAALGAGDRFTPTG